MPWTCKNCEAEVEDDFGQCPSCQSEKTAWTVVHDKTRTMVFARKRFELLRGESVEEVESISAYRDVVWREAQAIPALSRMEVQELLKRGLLPAPRDMLTVRLFPQKSSELSIQVAIHYAGREVEERSYEGGSRDQLEQQDEPTLDARFLCLFGEGELDPQTLPGLTVIDVSEDTERGHAPTLWVRSLGRPGQSLPVVRVEPEEAEVSLVLLDDWCSGPLVHKPYRLDLGDGRVAEGTTDSEGRLSHGPVPLGWYTITVDELRLEVGESANAEGEDPDGDDGWVNENLPSGSLTLDVPAVFAGTGPYTQRLPAFPDEDLEYC